MLSAPVVRSAVRRRRVSGIASVGVAAALLCACGSTVEPTAQPVNAANESLTVPGITPTATTGGSIPTPINTGTQPTTGLPAGPATTPGSGKVAITTPQTSAGSASSTPATVGTTGPMKSSQPGHISTSHAPIEIGFIVTKASNIGSFGVSSGQTFSDQQLDSAVVDAMNAAGGIDGRKIKPIYAVTDTAAATWAPQFQAACDDFTQDHHVAAVVGYIFVYLPSFESCLANAGIPHLFGGYQPGDIPGQSQFPTLVSTTNPTADVHYEIGLQGAIATGLISAKKKLGLVLDTCANDDQAFTHVGAPYLKSHHINFETFTIPCGEGSNDDTKATAAVASAVLHFRTTNVQTVWAEGPAALFFALTAEAQGWHPTYVMTFGGAAFEGNLPRDQLVNFHGFGWEPSVDVDPLHQPYGWTASEKRCLNLIKSRGLTPHGYNDYMEAFTTCDGLTLYDAALKADGGQTGAGQVLAALQSVIGKTPLASLYDGRGRYASDDHGGPAVYRQWGWSSGCACFRYTGPTRTVG